MQVIEAHGLRKTYGATAVVDGVDLEMGSGEVVAVIGPNGAGKTTTIDTPLGLRRPSAGTVRELTDLVGRYHHRALPVEDVPHRADLVSEMRLRVGQLSEGRRQRLSSRWPSSATRSCSSSTGRPRRSTSQPARRSGARCGSWRR